MSCLRELVIVGYDVGLGFVEGLGEVGEDVVDVLDAYGEADGGFGDVLLGEFFGRQLGVCRGGRMDYEALDICYVGKQ